MRHFLFDTNVLLDFLADRKPFSDQAEILFEYKQQKKINIFVSAISFNNLYYIINKIGGHVKAIKLLTELADLVNIIPLDHLIIQNSLKSNFSDFEDAIQYNSALNVKIIEGIITRNHKDFKHSELSILSPELAIKLTDEE
ncbi:MAG: PIN domain-containing protein [Bacteroidota bacterium]|nr:PIN domain-containing protein [Bacteroidota bacterium]